MEQKNNSIDWNGLLSFCLELGLTPSEFWQLTPSETMLLIERRLDKQKKDVINLAWLVAKLSRAKRIPSLDHLNGKFLPIAKKIDGEELEKRREEFKQMTQNFDPKKIKIRLKSKDN